MTNSENPRIGCISEGNKKLEKRYNSCIQILVMSIENMFFLRNSLV